MSGAGLRDAGLVRAVGTWSLAACILSTVVGAGIFTVPGALAACMGSYAPLVFLVCGLTTGAVALCLAEGGSRIPTSGGCYGYIQAVFGPLAGFVAGTLLWAGEALACGGIAAALADAMATLVPPTLRGLAHPAVIVIVIGGIAWVNIYGVEHGARLVNLVTVLKLAPLVIFVFAGIWAFQRANFVPQAATTTHGMGRALILAIFAFSGMESALNASGEVKQPARAIPRALAIALVSVMLLYLAIQIVAQGILGPGLSRSTAPLADAMARINAPLRALMLVGASVSMFGWISVDILAGSRILFAFGRDGLLPRMLGRAHTRTHSPYVAILFYAAIAATLAVTGTFAELAVLSMLAAAPLYAAGCAAAWLLKRKGVAQAGDPLNFRWLGSAAVVGIASATAMVALAARAEIFGLLAVIGASAAIYGVNVYLRRGQSLSKAAAGSGF